MATPRASNPLATMLILSAIDVLLCSFTAGIALFLMGDAGTPLHRHIQSGSSLSKDYLYVEVLGAPVDQSIFSIFSSSVRFGWPSSRQHSQSALIEVQPNVNGGCAAKDNGKSLWIIECDGREKLDWFAKLNASQPVNIRITIVDGPESRFCRANLAPSFGVRVFVDQPELRLESDKAIIVNAGQGNDDPVPFYCESGR